MYSIDNNIISNSIFHKVLLLNRVYSIIFYFVMIMFKNAIPFAQIFESIRNLHYTNAMAVLTKRVKNFVSHLDVGCSKPCLGIISTFFTSYIHIFYYIIFNMIGPLLIFFTVYQLLKWSLIKCNVLV